MKRVPNRPAPIGTILFLGLVISVALVGCGPAADGEKLAKSYVFFPAPPEVPRIQFLCNFHGTQDFAAPRSELLKFLDPKDASLYQTIAKPFGIAVVDGKIHVTDTKSASVAVIDWPKQGYEVFGVEGRGAFRKPINIRRGPDNLLYVTDTVRGQVVVYDADGEYVREYGNGTDFRPADVVVTDEEMFVLDISSHSIKVYDLQSGDLKRTFGGRGKGFGEYNYPSNMVMDDEGNIHVCDAMNFRIQKIDQNGKSLLQFGRVGRTPGHFARPKGIAVDRDGIVYVVDSQLGIVQLFDREGTPLMFLGRTGLGDGQLYSPAQITIDYDSVEHFREYIAPDFDAKYLVFVTNQQGPNKVSVFAFGLGKVPKPVPQPAQPAPVPAPDPSEAQAE